MTFGEDLGWGSNVKESEEIMDCYLELGVEGRGACMGHLLSESTFELLDELEKISKVPQSTVARVALAWLLVQRGVTFTIIGARHLSQLEDNLKAFEV